MWRRILDELRHWAKGSEVLFHLYREMEITVETEQVWIIRGVHAKRGWCAGCGRQANLVGLKEAAVLCGLGQGSIAHPPLDPLPSSARLFPFSPDGSEWHWSHAADGSPLICVESLLRAKAEPGMKTKTLVSANETEKQEPSPPMSR